MNRLIDFGSYLPHYRPDREAERYEGGQDEDGVKHRQHDQQLLYRLLQWKHSVTDKLIIKTIAENASG